MSEFQPGNGFMELNEKWAKMVAYYAHPMSWYDTKDEGADMDMMKAVFKDVYNPNNPSSQRAVEQARLRGVSPMEPFETIIKSRNVDCVVFRRFKDRKIGAGVAQEIMWAQIWGKPIIMIGGFVGEHRILYANPDVRVQDVLSIEQTRERIRGGWL